MFSRKRPETGDPKLSDAPADLGIPMKPARPAGPAATVAPLGRASPPLPPRTPESTRPAAEAPKPVEPALRPAPAPARRTDDDDLRKLIVGREISLSGEITSCDRL